MVNVGENDFADVEGSKLMIVQFLCGTEGVDIIGGQPNTVARLELGGG